MNPVPSTTYFSAPPEWSWLIVFYFFFGGLAGGCYFLASLIDLVGRPADRPLARLGYYIAFPCIIISALLLTFDLYRPSRFWHMLIESNTYQPIFKPWSPMSVGSWALFIFGIFSFVSFVGALVEDDLLAWPAGRKIRPPGILSGVIAVLGGLFGFYVAGYTGVLLTVTNRPIWSDTPLLGLLFIVSAASISAALMILLARRTAWPGPDLESLHRMDVWVVTLELLVLVALMISLGPVLRAWLSPWGLLLLLGVVVLGMLLPIVLYLRRGWLGELNMTTSAVLVLIGGFILRLVIVFSAQQV
jgi:protein NrfD